VTATLAGHTPIVFASLPPAVPQIKEGKLRALAVTSPTRSPTLPDVPTMAEAGYPEIEGEGWFAFIVPAGTPKNVIDLLHREIVKAMAQPDLREKMEALGFLAVDTTPEQAAALFRAERAKWSKVIRDAGIKAN
jgi:tripartite-type tricarboxylate transporter receptor subunit TctC